MRELYYFLYSFAYKVEAFFAEARFDLFNLFVVAGFQAQFQEAAGNCHIGIAAVMVYADYVSATAGNYVAYVEKLSRFIFKGNHKVGLATAHYLTAGDYAGENVYVNVATTYEAHNLLALDGKFVEKGCCHGSSTCTFGNKLLLLDECEDGCSDFVFANSDDFVNILFDDVKGVFTGSFYCDTISKSTYSV